MPDPQVLVDADNLDVPRLRLLAAALGGAPGARVVVAGSPAAVRALDWPAGAELHEATGWQGADLVLARAYRPERAPLLLATGDGDFVHLARRHPGPVLLVAAGRARSQGFRRDPAIVLTDPGEDGGAQLRGWLRGTAG